MITWNDAMIRFAEDRLLSGAEWHSLFVGIGLQPHDRLEPAQIVEARSLSELPLVAARLATLADGTRTETDHVLLALELKEAVDDHHILREGEPLPECIRRAAAAMGVVADAGAGLIRSRLIPPLVPHPPSTITAEELAAAVQRGFNDAAGRPDAHRDRGAVREDPRDVERG